MKKAASPDQLALLFQGHLGLITGPDLTLGDGVPEAISDALMKTFRVTPGPTYLDTCDEAVRAGHLPKEIQDAVTRVVSGRTQSNLTPRLSRVRWGGIISGAPDAFLEDLIRSETNKSPFRPNAVTIDSPTIAIPPRSVPLIKLLGTAGRDSLVVSKFEYGRARARWRTAIRAFLDLVKNAPVLCIGMSSLPWLLADVLAELASLPTFVSRLVISESDPLVVSGDIDRMVDPRTQLVIATGSPGDLIQQAEAGIMLPPTSVPAPKGDGMETLYAHMDLALLVNAQLDPAVKKEEREQLFEILFSPSSVHWDAFAHDLDFKRAAGDELLTNVEQNIAKPGGGDVIVVEGAAATGKTVVLKRVAYDLAKKGHVVLWLRSYIYPDAATRLDQLFKALAKLRVRGVCIIQDDPFGLGSVNLKLIGGAARSNDVRATFVLGVRSSEWSTREPAELLGPLKLLHTVQVPDVLDEKEWGQLEAYLRTLNIARTQQDARALLDGAASRSSRDVLSMLYWLIPQTRAHIQQSIKDEYFRLGDFAGFQRIVLGQAQHSSEILKRAYEIVAVADRYRASVPIEVLVSALGVDYQAWYEATTTAAAAWGLLYAEDNKEAETFVYRTRNDVVSNVLVEALNGGVASHSGEVRVLRNLIDACSGSHPSYREFCARILVGNEALQRLEYTDGADLYDRAIKTLPYPDKTIVHHKGIWERRKGHHPLEALKLFELALTTPVAPYARRGEADEHIYTSAAAAMIDAIKDGLLSADAGKERALSALAKARSGTFFNASAVHVYANLALELAEKLGIQTVDSKHLTTNALADVDRTVMVLEGNPEREVGEDVAMLRVVRDKIVVRGVDPNSAREQATEMWNTHQNQDGFCLAARALLHTARTSDRGGHYKTAFEYCCDCVKVVKGAGVSPSAALHDVRLHTLYEWRIHSWRRRPNGGFIDWDMFHLDVLNVGPTVAHSPLYRYFEAVALSHLGKWNDAAGAFAQVRQGKVPGDLLWSRRDALLDQRGNARQLQGTVRQVNQETFIRVEELGTDFKADRKFRWPNPGEITVCYVQFTFGGWWAVPQQP